MLPAAAAWAGTTLFKEARFDMGFQPDEGAGGWSRVGSGASFLLPDASLVINDNSNTDRIAFQTLLGEVQAAHRVTLTARVKVLSNIGGDAVTMEIARPGLEAVLQLYPDGLVLLERRGTGNYRFLGTVAIDLRDYHEIVLQKSASEEGPREILSVLIDGVAVLHATPQGEGQLGVGRLLIGSTSYADMGASFWDWVSYRLDSVENEVSTTQTSFGRLKSRFGG
jgi:hypothetical protein